VTEETTVPDGKARTASHSLRLTLLVVLSVLLLASVAAVVYLAATRPVSALGIDGDQDSLQSQRESVMAQSE
jgi:Mce-associated membrane protein